MLGALSAKAVRVSYGMVYNMSAATKPRTPNGKASLAETFFQKLFGKRRAARIEGSGSGFGAGGSIPGGGVDFWLDPGIWADYSILAWICDISAFFDLNGFSVILAGLKSRQFLADSPRRNPPRI